MAENEINIVMKKTDGSVKKRKLVIHFNNVGSPFMNLYLYMNDILDRTELIKFEDYEIVDGIPVNINKVVDIIHEFVYKVDQINLLISSDDTFKITTSLPKISKGRAMKIYRNDMKNENGDNKTKYYSNFELYKHSLGYIFYTYFIPMDIVTFFRKVASLLKTKLTKVDLFSHFIFNNVKNTIEEDFIYYYEENGLATFILSYGKTFTSYATFINDEANINQKYVSILAKHAFELERKEINVIYTNNKEKVLHLGECKDHKISLKAYEFKGIELWKRD